MCSFFETRVFLACLSVCILSLVASTSTIIGQTHGQGRTWWQIRTRHGNVWWHSPRQIAVLWMVQTPESQLVQTRCSIVLSTALSSLEWKSCLQSTSALAQALLSLGKTCKMYTQNLQTWAFEGKLNVRSKWLHGATRGFGMGFEEFGIGSDKFCLQRCFGYLWLLNDGLANKHLYSLGFGATRLYLYIRVWQYDNSPWIAVQTPLWSQKTPKTKTKSLKPKR